MGFIDAHVHVWTPDSAHYPLAAFRGLNVRDGALAGFLEACRVGRVPRGSHLIVESLDRPSWDEIRPALQLFLALQDFGVTIVTLQPERSLSTVVKSTDLDLRRPGDAAKLEKALAAVPLDALLTLLALAPLAPPRDAG